MQNHCVTSLLTCNYDIWDIAISPSNKYIAFAGNESGNWDIFLYDIENKTIRKLTNSQGNEWDPAFGSSDSEIWFAGTSGINNGIFYLTLDDTIIDYN
jgi:Tol biopolymer transport system component